MNTDVRQLPLFPSQPMTLADADATTALRDTIALFQQFLLREGKSEHTVSAFTADLQLLARYSGEDMPIGKYTTDKLNGFLYWLETGRGVPCSRKSYARRVTTLKVYFKWLHAHNVLVHDPAKALLQRSGPAPLAVILSPEEADRALAFARTMTRTVRGATERDTRPELLLRLLLRTGIKKNEAMLLTPASIDRTLSLAPLLVIRHRSQRDVYKERIITLEAGFPPLLDAYLAQYAPDGTLFNCTARNLEYILTDIGKGADIEEKLSFEMLRWTCAVRDYRAGVEPDLIREKLGLSPVSWTETFAKIKKLAERLAQDER